MAMSPAVWQVWMCVAIAFVVAIAVGGGSGVVASSRVGVLEANGGDVDAGAADEQVVYELALEAEAEREADAAAMRFAHAQAETEAEAEAEAEVNAEASSAAESEVDAEAGAEAAMGVGASIRAQHRALNSEANARFAVASRWFSWNKAGNAHAQLLDAALSTLTQADGPDTVKRVFDREPLLAGIEWNDRPSGSDAHPSEEPLELDTFHREYEFHGAHASLVHNVHFGCLQHFHSQCPSVQRPDLQNEFGDDRYVFSNSDVRDLIVGQIRYWWLNAVDAQLQSGGPTQRAPKPNANTNTQTDKAGTAGAAAAAPGKPVSSNSATPSAGGSSSQPARMPAPVTPSKDANFALGHILATVQDAWTKSHVLRSVEDVNSPAASEIDNDSRSQSLAENCGHVQYFQGGDAQEGNQKKALETAQDSAAFHSCAQYYSYVVLKAFERCATASVASPNSADDQTQWCTFETALKPVLEEGVYPLAAEHESASAGGSMAKYASPRIDRLGYRKVVYDVSGVGHVTVWEPSSTKLWRSLGADDLQVSLCHSVKGKVRNFNGVTYRDETFKDFQNVVRGGRQLQAVVCSVESRRARKTGPYWVASATGTCEKHGWRLGSGCGSHQSCRPSKIGGCKGRCMCGRKGSCRCMKRFDPTTERCSNRGDDITEPK